MGENGYMHTVDACIEERLNWNQTKGLQYESTENTAYVLQDSPVVLFGYHWTAHIINLMLQHTIL